MLVVKGNQKDIILGVPLKNLSELTHEGVPKQIQFGKYRKLARYLPTLWQTS